MNEKATPTASAVEALSVTRRRLRGADAIVVCLPLAGLFFLGRSPLALDADELEERQLPLAGVLVDIDGDDAGAVAEEELVHIIALVERGAFLIPDIFLNSGGVTASYFEWVKNLSHISFARMTKRQQEISNRRIVEMMERVTGKLISTSERNKLTRGPNEIDFVYTALEETIAVAYGQIRSVWKERALPDLRTAAFVLAIERIGNCYLSQGIFP